MIDCIHHWMIGEAHGPKSMGVCKKCGAVKEHPNTLSDKERWQIFNMQGNRKVFAQQGTFKRKGRWNEKVARVNIKDY